MTESTLKPVPAVYQWRWAGLAALLVAEAMNLLDSTIVQIAAPTIHADPLRITPPAPRPIPRRCSAHWGSSASA